MHIGGLNYSTWYKKVPVLQHKHIFSGIDCLLWVTSKVHLNDQQEGDLETERVDFEAEKFDENYEFFAQVEADYLDEDGEDTQSDSINYGDEVNGKLNF